MIDERRDLFAPLAQRRQPQADDVEAVEEVLAEASLGDQRLEVGVGGGDDAHVDLDRLRLAEAVHFVRLEEAEQLGLQVEADLGDLVEEQRAAGGGADDAVERRFGAGEGPLAVAEQLALEHLARDRGAVEGDERLGRARPEARWMARASTSLPVPVSPVSSTLMSAGAMRRAIESSSVICSETQRPPSVSSVSAGHSAARCFSSRR